MIQQQGLVLDPKFFRIRDAGSFISGNVSFIHLVHIWGHVYTNSQNVFIYYINYFHKFNLNIRLLTYYKPSEAETRTLSRSRFSPDPWQWNSISNHFILRHVHDVGLWYSQIWLINLNKYCHKFKLYIRLLSYKPSEWKTRTSSWSGYSPVTRYCSVNHSRECCFHTYIMNDVQTNLTDLSH